VCRGGIRRGGTAVLDEGFRGAEDMVEWMLISGS
jgi:hypothetical protein